MPGVHFVPAATGIATDQVPEAQRWNDVPSRQLYAPSLVQAPVWEPAPPPEVGGAGAEVGVDGEVSLPPAEGVGELPESAEVGAGELPVSPEDGELEPPDGAATGAVVAKTPPGRLDVAGDAGEADVANVLAGGLPPSELAGAPDPDPDPEPVSPPLPATAEQVPVKVSAEFPVLPVTSGPGSGKITSVPSLTVQPLPRLATKIPGRDLKATDARLAFLDLAAPMVTAAQFM